MRRIKAPSKKVNSEKRKLIKKAVKIVHQRMNIKWYCACTNTLCSGICKKKHLYRPRKTLEVCPAAFEKGK